jgi:hypothetical protein
MKNIADCLTYSIVSPESAEQVEYSEVGFILELDDIENLEYSLRELISELFSTRACHVGGIAHIGGIYGDMAYIQVTNSMEFETGCYESRTLFFRDNCITKSSFRRLCALLDISVIN